MAQFKKLVLLLIILSPLQELKAQYTGVGFFENEFVGVSVIKTAGINPAFGLYGGSEFGIAEKIRGIVRLNFTPFQSNTGTFYTTGIPFNSDQGSILVPYDIKLRYASMNVNARYYFTDLSEEKPTFYADAGLLFQNLFYDANVSNYDNSNYYLDNTPMSAMQGRLGISLSAGYQYTFLSGLIVDAHLGYEQVFGTIYTSKGFGINENDLRKNTNSLILGFGVKYNLSFSGLYMR